MHREVPGDQRALRVPAARLLWKAQLLTLQDQMSVRNGGGVGGSKDQGMSYLGYCRLYKHTKLGKRARNEQGQFIGNSVG